MGFENWADQITRAVRSKTQTVTYHVLHIPTVISQSASDREAQIATYHELYAPSVTGQSHVERFEQISTQCLFLPV